jgi:phosphate acetyltransferase
MASKFVERLEQELLATPGTVILPEGSDPRTIEAAILCLERSIAATVKVIGEVNDARESIPKEKLSNLESLVNAKKLIFISSDDENLRSSTYSHLSDSYKARGKEVDQEKLNTLSQNPLNQGAYLLSSDQGDVCVAGAVFTTADVIRAGLAGVGLKPGLKTVSSSFLMNRDHDSKTYIYTDCGVVIDPTTDQLVDITTSSVETYSTLNNGKSPVVAFLSFSTKGSASHPRQQKMVEAFNKFKMKYPEIESEGELQFDAAFDEAVGNKKSPGSKVPGRANVFVFPDLDSGNISYKITQRLGGFEAYGPILQGFNKPFSDLSRGATAEDIYVSCVISLIRGKA